MVPGAIIIGVDALGLSALSSGCKFGMDRKASVEKTVGELFEQLAEIKAATVVCPGEKIEDGDIVCTVTTVDGVDVAVNVNVKGNKVLVKGKDPLVVMAKFSSEIGAKLPEGAGEVTCSGKGHLVPAQGAVIECATDKLDVRVEFKDATGNYHVTWRDKGAAGAAPGLPAADAPFAKPDEAPAHDSQ